MPTMQNGLHNNRYGSASSNIVEQGRIESQRLLMERYRRIELNEQNLIKGSAHGGVSENRLRHYNGMGRVPDIHAMMNNQGVPTRTPQNDGQQSRHYIPMSQKGSRPIKYTGQGGSNPRMMNPSAAMRMVYNQPSAQGRQAQPESSRPVWWG